MTKTWKEIPLSLLHPVKVGERSVSTITLYEPNVEALEALEDAGLFDGKPGDDPKPLSVKQMRAALVALSRESEETIRGLHAADFAKAGESIAPLLASFTGSAAPKDGTE